MYIFLMLKEV